MDVYHIGLSPLLLETFCRLWIIHQTLELCNQVSPENVALLKITYGVMTKTIIQAGILMDELVVIISTVDGTPIAK